MVESFESCIGLCVQCTKIYILFEQYIELRFLEFLNYCFSINFKSNYDVLPTLFVQVFLCMTKVES